MDTCYNRVELLHDLSRRAPRQENAIQVRPSGDFEIGQIALAHTRQIRPHHQSHSVVAVGEYN
jgi:hypothetical protein